MKTPIISIIMAVYNGASLLQPTLSSVRAQTFTDYEFIIVNDGSTDETASIIEKLDDPRIRLIHNPRNMGQTTSLNVGLQEARGIYIARTDAGDISAPERLRKQFEYLENDFSVDILGTAAVQYDERGNFSGNVFMPNNESTIIQRIFFACPVVHVSIMARRNRILELEGYNESYKILADYDLWARALCRGYRFWNIDEILTGYLVTQDSFGAFHGTGRSVQEASRIIVDLARILAGEHISTTEAEALYRFFVFGPRTVNAGTTGESEVLFEKLLTKLGIPKRDIDYFLLRSHVKTFLNGRSSIPSPQYMNQVALRSIFKRLGGLLSAHVPEDACLRFKSMRRNYYQIMGMSIPVFAHHSSGTEDTVP